MDRERVKDELWGVLDKFNIKILRELQIDQEKEDTETKVLQIFDEAIDKIMQIIIDKEKNEKIVERIQRRKIQRVIQNCRKRWGNDAIKEAEEICDYLKGDRK